MRVVIVAFARNRVRKETDIMALLSVFPCLTVMQWRYLRGKLGIHGAEVLTRCLAKVRSEGWCLPVPFGEIVLSAYEKIENGAYY